MKHEFIIKVVAALMLLLTIVAMSGETYYYVHFLIWKVQPDSTTEWLGSYAFSDQDEACKNSEYEFYRWINRYKAFEDDEDLDSLIVYYTLLGFDSTNTICAILDTIYCGTVDFGNVYGGSTIVPVE